MALKITHILKAEATPGGSWRVLGADSKPIATRIRRQEAEAIAAGRLPDAGAGQDYPYMFRGINIGPWALWAGTFTQDSMNFSGVVIFDEETGRRKFIPANNSLVYAWRLAVAYAAMEIHKSLGIFEPRTLEEAAL